MTLAERPRELDPTWIPDEPRRARFTKAEFFKMIERGAFADFRRRISLFRGELYEMPPMGWNHMTGLRMTSKWANRTLGGRFEICVQCPFETPSDDYLPEPDIAIYTAEQVGRRPYPEAAELLIEIADSSRLLDFEKAAEYATGAKEYWVLDLPARALVVYRNPHPDPTATFGVAFDPPMTLDETRSIAPLCDPTATVLVRNLLGT